jgi:hypothetical protein
VRRGLRARSDSQVPQRMSPNRNLKGRFWEWREAAQVESGRLNASILRRGLSRQAVDGRFPVDASAVYKHLFFCSHLAIRGSNSV